MGNDAAELLLEAPKHCLGKDELIERAIDGTAATYRLGGFFNSFMLVIRYKSIFP